MGIARGQFIQGYFLRFQSLPISAGDYNMLVRDAGADGTSVRGPFLLVCDCVAKTLKEEKKRKFESVQAYYEGSKKR